MKRSKRSAFLFLTYCAFAWSQSQSLPSTPEPRVTRQSASVPEFAEAQRLMQQGKYDEAVSKLKELEAKNPGLKGLSHELGVSYYKKSEYLEGCRISQAGFAGRLER